MEILNQYILFLLLSLGYMGLSAQTLEWSMKANPNNNSINGVAFSANGQKIVSGTDCHPASIRIFDVATSALNWDYTVGGSYMCIMGVSFSSNMNYIAAIEEFGNIFIFDNTITTPTLLNTINTGTSYGFATAISPLNDKIVVGCSNGKLQIYDLTTSAQLNNISAHASWVTTVAYSDDANFIITGGSDAKVKIWSNTGSLLFTCNGHTDYITNVKVSPDNQFVISASKDDKIKIWDISTGNLVRTISGHTDNVNGIDISPDGSKLVSCSSDLTCKIWDFNTGLLISTFGSPNTGAFNTVAWSPNGNKIVTGSANSDVMLWRVDALSNIQEEIPSNFIKIYPNPAQQVINISITKVTDDYVIGIYNSLGQVQAEYKSDLFQTIDISSLTKGFYYIKIGNRNQLFTYGLIIE